MEPLPATDDCEGMTPECSQAIDETAGESENGESETDQCK